MTVVYPPLLSMPALTPPGDEPTDRETDPAPERERTERAESGAERTPSVTDVVSAGETSDAVSDALSGLESDAPTEADSARDGFLSYAAEWHAFTHGVYVGFTTAPWKTPPAPENPDIAKEPHYYRGGYMLGTFLQLAVLAATGGTAVEAGALDAFL